VKILMIVPYPIFPPDEGGRRRAYSLLKYLAPQHELALMTPRSEGNRLNDLPVKLYQTTPPGRLHQIVSPAFVRHAPEIIRRERPDVIITEYPWSGLHAAYLAKRFGVPLVLDAPNVEGDRFRSTGNRYWRLIAGYESIVARAAKRIFVVSEEDRERYVRAGIARLKIDIVPNGVDPSIMRPDADAGAAVRAALGIAPATRMLLFFGQLDYAPNREALDIIAREILPRLPTNMPIVIAGKGDVTDLRRSLPPGRVRFTGPVPEIAPYINAADIVLAPIVSGGGTRLKILESIACGTPVVSTTLGAEGIDRGACGGLLTIADGWDAFAACLTGDRLVKSGNVPAGFLDMYSWASIVGRIDWAAIRR
jgi:glycosyltransferase involved in cell wall biosynthesis